MVGGWQVSGFRVILGNETGEIGTRIVLTFERRHLTHSVKFIAPLSDYEQDVIMGGTAIRAYKLDSGTIF